MLFASDHFERLIYRQKIQLIEKIPRTFNVKIKKLNKLNHALAKTP